MYFLVSIDTRHLQVPNPQSIKLSLRNTEKNNTSPTHSNPRNQQCISYYLPRPPLFLFTGRVLMAAKRQRNQATGGPSSWNPEINCNISIDDKFSYVSYFFFF